MNKTWILSLATVIAALLLADYFFIHVLFPIKRAAVLQDLNREVEEHLREHPFPGEPSEPSTSPENEPGSAAPTSGESTFATAVRECFASEATAATPRDLLQRLKARGVASLESPLENWHLLRPDGTQERVMLVASDRENARGAKELRLFGVDREGLPVPKSLDLPLNPSAEDLRRVLARGAVKFHQREDILNFADGTSASVEWINGDIRDLQVFGPESTLSCRHQDCRCQALFPGDTALNL